MTTNWVSKAREINARICDFVAGRQCEATGERIRKPSPRDGQLLYEFSASTEKEVDQAVSVSRKAFEDERWSGRSMQHRKEVLLKFASLIDQHHEELALCECLDVGKPITDALSVDGPLAAAIVRYNAEAIDKLHDSVYAAGASSLCYQLRRPAGVVGAVVGWNFPLVLAIQKIAPALAMGNALVLKPSEFTCLTGTRIAGLAIEAGVPEGVFNVVHGGGAVGDRIARHPDIDVLTFTGSSRTGKRLLVATGESNMKRLILECGGKAPNIVFEDCPELEAVAEAIVGRAFWNQGEVCSASSRLLVQESIHRELLEAVNVKANALRPGDPLKADTTFGALVSKEHEEKVLSYIESGQREGARLLQQSPWSPPFADGFYVAPTIFDRVSPSYRIAQEEIFGPVLSVFSFRDEAEAIHIANSTPYGLTAIVWTQSLARAHRLAYGIRAGSIVVNAAAKRQGGPPIGALASGGLKESGLGVEGGLEGLAAYTEQSTIQLFT